MNNSIQVPSENVYDEKSKEFFNSKLAQRLQQKYNPKPFEDTYKPVYTISKIISYFCNLFSILSASTFLFSYLVSIFLEIPYPYIWASIFAGTLLISIEVLQRILLPEFLKTLFQYGFKVSSLVLLTIILLLSALSLHLSYSGGFDVINKLLSPPTYQAPILADTEVVKKEYNELILNADKDAEAYKSSKLYLGRLSDIHAKAYKELLTVKATLQTAMLDKINNLEAKNETLLATSKAEYKEALKTHENKLVSKGSGMASFAIFSQVLFFFSILFMEYFDYRTAAQYAFLGNIANSVSSELPITKTPYNFNIKSNVIATQANVITPTSTNKPSVKKQPKTKLKQEQTATKTIFVEDKKTIEHNGKYYTLEGVNNFINIYQKRVADANKKNNVPLANSRKETLKYWLERKSELLNK